MLLRIAMALSTETIPLLSLEDGTLCDFCDRLFREPQDSAEIIRPLSDLMNDAEYCQYCQCIQRSLEASAEAVTNTGERVSMLKHPLLQNKIETNKVKLQYLQ